MTTRSISQMTEETALTSVRSQLESASFDLVVDDLYKSFSQEGTSALQVLNGVAFTAHAGEMVAVVGASGAGKSTLLHLLAGLESPDRGYIRAGTLEVTASSPRDLARFRRSSVGYVYQLHRLLPDLSAEENVALPLLVARKDSRDAITAARELLEWVGLTTRSSHKPGELSGGEQQRVAVARALVTRPRLVLADEPTGNLDGTTGSQVGDLFFSICRRVGTCVIVATHNIELARRCDRILTLRDGRIEKQLSDARC